MKIILMSIFILATSLAQADNYYVSLSETTLRNNPELAETLRGLVESELLRFRQDIVSSPDQAEWVLAPSLLKLNESYIISLTKFKNGRNFFSDKLKATTLDDLDVITTRLVEAAIYNRSVENTQRIGTVTEEERKGLSIKQRADKQFYLGFGPGAGANLETNNAGFSWLVGYLWGLDRQFSLRLNLEGVNINDSGADMTSLGIGAQYFFNDKKHSPYFFGAMAYAWADSDRPNNETLGLTAESDNGWAIQTGLGYKFFRTSTVGIGVELSYNQALFNLVDGSPSTFATRVILFW